VQSGKILIFALAEAAIRKVVAVEFIPEEVVVTTGFGFIVAYGRRRLAVFPVNGSKIREGEFEWEFVTFSPFTNGHGFDFLLIVDEKQRIRAIEVFDFKVTDLEYNCPSPVGILKHDTRKRWIVAATHDGHVFCMPFEPAETVLELADSCVQIIRLAGSSTVKFGVAGFDVPTDSGVWSACVREQIADSKR
jgi:hypothetical protein